MSTLSLDQRLSQMALKLKNLWLIDLSFPGTLAPEFKSNHASRFIHMPCRQESAMAYASGLASTGKLVLLMGLQGEPSFSDETLNLKVLKQASEADWESLEDEVLDYGAAVLLIPPAE